MRAAEGCISAAKPLPASLHSLT